MDDELTGEERAAIVAFTVCRCGCINRARVMRLTGLSADGAKKLVCKISRVIPIYYEVTEHSWKVTPLD